jgi:hypothetical protein
MRARAVRIRRIALAIVLLVCGADAATGWLGPEAIDPPRVEALGVSPVIAHAPAPPPTMPVPTYAPTPHLSPVVTTVPAPAPSTSTPATTAGAATTSTVTASPAAPAEGPSIASATAPVPANVARVKGATILVWNDPRDRAPALALYGTTEFGTPRVLLTTALQGDWIRVLLPVRPNGAQGWVRAKDVEISAVQDHIDVDLAARTLTWTRAGAVLLQASAAVGAPASPTPTGTFFVTDVLAYDASGSHGAWVVALNGHSDAFTEFDGGDARIAIHGTNDPASIGQAASNGCVRLAAGPLDTLRASVPLGTPVVIR